MSSRGPEEMTRSWAENPPDDKADVAIRYTCPHCGYPGKVYIGVNMMPNRRAIRDGERAYMRPSYDQTTIENNPDYMVNFECGSESCSYMLGVVIHGLYGPCPTADPVYLIEDKIYRGDERAELLVDETMIDNIPEELV